MSCVNYEQGYTPYTITLVVKDKHAPPKKTHRVNISGYIGLIYMYIYNYIIYMCVCPFIIPARSSSGGFTRVKERVGPVAASAQDAEAHVWVAQIEGYFKCGAPPEMLVGL